MRVLLFILFIGFSGDAIGQAEKQVFTMVEQMPEFPGNINDFISKNIHYPKSAIDSDIQGKVIVKFVVNEDGKVSDAQVLRRIGGGCDEEALRIFSLMPLWKPGKQNGRAVKVYYTLPITFRLESATPVKK